ncbi:MAG: hypothetical protein AAB316_04455, partial [Bacteroidota bacterium]
RHVVRGEPVDHAFEFRAPKSGELTLVATYTYSESQNGKVESVTLESQAFTIQVANFILEVLPIPLVEGDIVKLGYFSMVVNDATPSAEGVSGGTGSILAARSETQRIFMVRQALTKSRWSCRRRAATIFPSSSRCR